MDGKDMQRWSTVAAGVLLTAAGARKGGRNGLLLSLAGGALAVLGYATRRSSESVVFDKQRLTRWQMPRDRLLDDAKAFGRTGPLGEDAVHEASDESFPASDAPSYTPNTSIGGHDKS